MDTLRFITCGSVDDGKSTLIGRLLFASGAIHDDLLHAITSDSRVFGTQGENIDLALVVDGLQAEREQGITIDVAYRFFSSKSRRFVIADTPGHLQYTRNMVTGASTADVAVILVDARKGVLSQTKRHSRIVAMMGIRHVLLAINKMDLVSFDASVFGTIVNEFQQFAEPLSFTAIHALPVSALGGDNVVEQSANMPWYKGPTLLAYLDSVQVSANVSQQTNSSFYMPIQWVNRPSAEFRGFSGRIASGVIRKGDQIRILPSGVASVVMEILVGFEKVREAIAGESVTLTMHDQIDGSRGDVIVAGNEIPEVVDQFSARLIWMHEQPLIPGRQYLMKLAAKEVTATVTGIRYLEDVHTGAHLAANLVTLNDIAVVNVSLSAPVVFEPYVNSRSLGGFILIDKQSFDTVGAGLVKFALRRSKNIVWQAIDVNQASRASIKNQKACCIWLTGLSGSGKSTIANHLEKRLHAEGRHTYILDGDNLRHGLNRDLGFTQVDRVENVRRVAQVAKLMVDAGLITIVSLISPFRSDREMARGLFGTGEFIEVYIDAPLAVCERRDPKGLYAKARIGKLPSFTGIDSPYEAPNSPEIVLCTEKLSIEACVHQLAHMLQK